MAFLWNYYLVSFSLSLFSLYISPNCVKRRTSISKEWHFLPVLFKKYYFLFSYCVLIVESTTLGRGGTNYNNWRRRWWRFACNMIYVSWVMLWIMFVVLWNRYSIHRCLLCYIRWRDIVRDYCNEVTFILGWRTWSGCFYIIIWCLDSSNGWSFVIFVLVVVSYL